MLEELRGTSASDGRVLRLSDILHETVVFSADPAPRASTGLSVPTQPVFRGWMTQHQAPHCGLDGELSAPPHTRTERHARDAAPGSTRQDLRRRSSVKPDLRTWARWSDDSVNRWRRYLQKCPSIRTCRSNLQSFPPGLPRRSGPRISAHDPRPDATRTNRRVSRLPPQMRRG